MLIEPKTIIATKRAQDYGQPEDLEILRATLHACRNSLQFAQEAFENFFNINTFIVTADPSLRYPNWSVYYVNGQGFAMVRKLLK